MKVSALSLIAAVALVALLSGCATWYSRTPVGLRHTRMMVNTEQEYGYYVDPVQQPPDIYYGETPFDRIKRFFTRSDY